MKKELLSPAGNFDALKMAVIHGADAVYVGGKKFGARAFATNFSDEEMLEAIFYCHLHGVKLYVTVNTMIYESELESVLAYISFLYQNHVDAIIMADLGLMKLCHDMFPDLEIHASTQAHTHNIEQIKLFEKLGVKRVVLARELSLKEINLFPKSMEYEVFIHGALCISYSGQCLFSSLLLDRSGNRGSCAQICRLPFSLCKNGAEIKTNGNYLLSTKDLNTSTIFSQLLSSNITSFKIEGRMKSPAYVGYITQMYRSLMNEFDEKKSCFVTNKMVQSAAVLFHRGFTEGKIDCKSDQDFMNQSTSNHQGILIGEVLSISNQKIKILLQQDLHQEDGIRFLEEEKGMIVNFLYNEKDLLISNAKRGEIVFVDNKIHLTKKCKVMKTMDSILEKEILNQKESKIPLQMRANITLNGIFLWIFDGEKSITLSKDIVTIAKNCPITESKVKAQLTKLGNTPFYVQSIEIQLEDHLFLSIKDLNDFRREAIDLFIKKRVERKEITFGRERRETPAFDSKVEVYATVRKESQLKKLLSFHISGIYVEDLKLYQKYQNKNVIYRTNRVQHHIKKENVSSILAGETGSFISYDCEKSTDYFFNIANHAASDLLIKNHAKRICLSPEMKEEELRRLLEFYPQGNPFEIILYGRLEVMVLNHCILKMNVNQEQKCQVCKRKDQYTLKDRNGAMYPMIMDSFHHTHIFYHSIKNDISKLNLYYQLGIRKFRLEFLDETDEEIEQIINSVLCSLQV